MILRSRFDAIWPAALKASVASALAWLAAQWIFGHPQPLFAAVSAILCLAPGLPSHVRQALGLLLGVATGVAIGEAMALLPEGWELLRMAVASFLAITVAGLYGQQPVVAIQAGVSAMMVIVMGPAQGGLPRIEDVAVGTLVGLSFSQLLLTPDPLREIDRTARRLLLELAKGFDLCRTAAETRDFHGAEAGLRAFSAARDRFNALGTGIGSAREAARWSLRGRLAARALRAMAARFDRHALRLYAASVLFSDTLYRGLRDAPEAMPGALPGRINALSERLRREAGRERQPAPVAPDMPRLMPLPDHGTLDPLWQACVDTLRMVEAALDRYESGFGTPARQRGGLPDQPRR